MAPFSKLFGSSLHDVSLLPSTTRTPPLATSRGHGSACVSRLVSKSGPTLVASVTTAIVEFSGTGAGKSVSVFLAHTDNGGTWSFSTPSSICVDTNQPPHIGDVIVLPRAPRRVQSLSVCLSNSGTGRDRYRHHRQICSQKRKSSQLSLRSLWLPLFPLGMAKIQMQLISLVLYLNVPSACVVSRILLSTGRS